MPPTRPFRFSRLQSTIHEKYGEMEQSGNWTEIEVRSLTGESIRVSIEPNKTVQDLKLILKQSFSPASSSPNFHIFFKGIKLNLHSQISSYLIGFGEFLVVVPFVKKDRQNRHTVEASEAPSEDPNPNEKFETELAESAWSDLMQDLSSIQHIPNSGNLPKAELKSKNSENENAHDRGISTRAMKRKIALDKGKEKGHSSDVILSILQTSGGNMFDEQNIQKLIEFMDSLCCLSSPATGSCVMREVNPDVPQDCELDPCRSSSCLCPLWLKDIMRAFSFINIYSACLQLWQKRVTFSALKGPLDQLHIFGFRAGIADLELLSQVCPQVIRIVNNEAEATKVSDALVITKFSTEKNDQHEDQFITAAKRVPRYKIINAMKKRETSLKAILSEAAKSLMVKKGSKLVNVSVEDLLAFVKNADSTAAETEVKQERRKQSPALSSHSYEAPCHVSQILLFKSSCQWLFWWWCVKRKIRVTM